MGRCVAALVQTGQTGQMTQADALLAPVLAERTPFRLLGHISEAVGTGPLEAVNPFLEHIAAARTEGGWVVIGRAVGAARNWQEPVAKSRSLAGQIARWLRESGTERAAAKAVQE